MRNGLVLFIALVVVATAGIGLWIGSSRDAKHAFLPAAPAPVASRTETMSPPSTAVDLSNPPPDIHITSSGSAPAPILVNEPAIRGRVVDEFDMPVEDAAVTVYHADTGPYRSFTDSSGTFAIGNLVEGRQYRVSAVKAMYNEAVHEQISARTHDVVLLLTATSTAAGRVVDEFGNPVTRFEVVYLKDVIEDELLWKEIVRSGATVWQKFENPQGRYEIADVGSEAAFSLGARADGFEATVIAVPAIAPAEQALAPDIVLKTGARIEGLVLSPQRTPVPGATVHLGPDADGPIVGRTDEAGMFAVTGLDEAPIALTAGHDAYLPATVRVSPRRGEVAAVEIVFGQGGTLVGRVTRGQQPAQAQTVLASRLTAPRILKQAITDADGQYRIDGLGAGTLDVLAKYALPDGSSIRIQSQVEIVAGDETTLNVDFPNTLGTLEGSITANGDPVAFAEIQGTVDTPQGRATFNTTAREDGFYRVENIPPGNAGVTVIARAHDAELRRTTEAEIRAGEATQLNIDFDASASISGKVSNIAADEVGQVLALSGHDAVDVSTAEAVLRLESIRAGESEIDEHGHFSITGLEPGDYTLLALVFRADADTGDDAINSIRVGTATTALPEFGSVSVDLTLSP